MSIAHQILSYIQWLPQTIHLHGIHSPFVFALEKDCLRDLKNYPNYETFDHARKRLLSNSQQITISDLGAGSQQLSRKRKINSIAKIASASSSRMRLLYRLARYFEVEHVLELGTSIGLGSLALSRGAKQVTTWEGCPQTAEVAGQLFHDFKVDNVELEVGSFSASLQKLEEQRQKNVETLSKAIVEIPSYDLIYLDGHHEEKATLEYFEQLLPFISSETVILLDDIYWSSGMTKAWQRIKAHPKVTITVDCFHLGLVFFKTDQAREHFQVIV